MSPLSSEPWDWSEGVAAMTWREWAGGGPREGGVAEGRRWAAPDLDTVLVQSLLSWLVRLPFLPKTTKINLFALNAMLP